MPDRLIPLKKQAEHPVDRTANARVLLLFLVGMLLLWTLACAFSHTSPDLDSMEELVWASSFELGYTKHPPFPTWVLYVFTLVLGKPVWLPFFVGMLGSVLALWFVWKLGCELTSPQRALIATLLISVSTYFTTRATIFNHDTAQLWSIAACCWLFYRALRYQKSTSWLALGVVAGLSMLTKYSAVIQFAAFFLFMLVQGHLLQGSTWKGIGLALVAFAVTISPHLVWLVNNQFAPFGYLDGSIEAGSYFDAVYGVFNFAFSQLGRISPFILAAIVLVVWDRRKRNRSLQTYASTLAAWDRSFLLWVGLGPFLLTFAVSLVAGTRLAASWGTTFFVLYGYFVFWFLSGNTSVTLKRCLMVIVAFQVLMASGYGIARGPVVHNSDRTARASFPGPTIAREMQAVWNEHLPDIPLRLVASDTWMGGNIAVHTSPRTQVFINGDWAESPWLDPATATQCGMLVAYSTNTGGEPNAKLRELRAQAKWQGEYSLPWSVPGSRVIAIEWGVIPPATGCRDAIN